MDSKLNLTFSRGHDYVKIGGVKWATMNIGAKSITDTGLYFAWGETIGYNDAINKIFGWDHYKFGGIRHILKYIDGFGPITLQPQDDSAHVNWRGNWRMPTHAEFNDLLLNTIKIWVENYQNSGVNGVLMTDKTNPFKTLFFPAAGYAYGRMFHLLRNENGFYWSSSLNPYVRDYEAYNLYLCQSMDNAYCLHNSRCIGFPIRAVLDD